MDTQVIIQVTAYISHSISEHRLLEGYDRLAAALRQAVLTSPPSLSPTVQAALAPLCQAHEQLRLRPPTWTAVEESLYFQLGAAEMLGAGALAQLEQIAHQQRTDPEAAGDGLDALRQATALLYEKTTRLSQALESLSETATPAQPLLPVEVGLSFVRTLPAGLVRRQTWTNALAPLERARHLVRQRPAVATLAAATPLVVSLVSAAAKLWELHRQSKAVGSPTVIRPATDANQAPAAPSTLHITHYTVTHITLWPSKDH